MSLKPLVLQWFWPHERGAYQERVGEEEEDEEKNEDKQKRRRKGSVRGV